MISDPVLVAMVGAAGLIVGSLAGLIGQITAARYTNTVKTAILEHESVCPNIPPLVEALQALVLRIDRLVDRELQAPAAGR